MKCVLMKPSIKFLGLLGVVVLALVLAGGLLDGPARAQAPDSEPTYFELVSPKTALQGPEAKHESVPLEENRQAESPTSHHYLRIVSLDGYSGRAMPGLTYHVYDRDENIVTEVTSECSGYVDIENLDPGHYRVELKYESGDPYIAYGSSYTRWMFVGGGYSATIRFNSYPTVHVAGIRVNAYDIYAQSRPASYLGGGPISVYDYSGAPVYSGTTNCSGFVDFFDLNPGWYRVVAGTGEDPQATSTPDIPTPPSTGVSPSQYYGSNEVWVPVYTGYLVSVPLYLDPAALPQVTATPSLEPTATETPGPGTPTATTGPPTNTPTPTATPTATQPAPPPPPPGGGA